MAADINMGDYLCISSIYCKAIKLMVQITDHGDDDMEEERIIVLAEEFIEYYEGSKRPARAGSRFE